MHSKFNMKQRNIENYKDLKQLYASAILPLHIWTYVSLCMCTKVLHTLYFLSLIFCGNTDIYIYVYIYIWYLYLLSLWYIHLDLDLDISVQLHQGLTTYTH